MASDADWVEDVRRWFLAGRQEATALAQGARSMTDESNALGYEAAHPALQARHWPDAPSGVTVSPTPHSLR
jgi:hypothetical protein